MSATGFTVVRGGRLLDAPAHKAAPVDILIEDDTIREIGAPGLAAPAGARAIDARDRLLIPGLVNAHTHGHLSLAKGMAQQWTLELHLNASPWTQANRRHEDKHLAAALLAVELVRKGCTTCYDLFFEFPGPSIDGLASIGQAYADVGVRAVIAPMLADRMFWRAIPGLFEALPEDLRPGVEKIALGPYQASLAVCREAARTWRFNREQLRLALAPTIPLHCSDEFMTGCRDLAREFGLGLQTHLGESKIQAVSGYRRYGKSLTAHLDALGLLGPDFTAAHAIWLDDDDLKRLGDRGASVAHNPASNMRLGAGLAAVRAMTGAGVNVGLGTDANSCSDNLNLFEGMKLASFVSRVRTPDYPAWLSAEEVFAMATVGSARALGFGDAIGRIAPGAKADIVFLDLTGVNYRPLNDPTNQVVYCEDGTGIDSVMIGGRMVLDHGRITTIDEAKLHRDAEAAIERLRAANAENKVLVERLEPAIGRFCMALAREPFHVHRYASDEGMKHGH